MDDVELIKRLCLSALLGSVLGLEREWRGKSAGLRTNILIAMGSTLFTMMSIDVSTGSGGDSTRIASGIVTGIGFIGAGAIMRTGAGIKGLTTAAMIWVNAAIGVAVGGGEHRVAVIATVVTLVVLVLLDPVERVLARRRPRKRPARRPTDDGSSEEP
jgi:putative Mg2+ transporter-C (MgtC) family protein